MAILRGASPCDAAAGDHREETATPIVLDMVPPSGETSSARPVPRTGAASGTPTRHDKIVATRPSLRGGWAEGLRALNHEFGGFTDARMRPSPVGVPPGATFKDHVYANEAGSRNFYVSASWKGKPLPLVVDVARLSADDFAAGTRMNDCAEEYSFVVAYPQQTASANSSRCWKWFNGSEQRRGSGEPSLIAGIMQQIMREFPVARGRVCVAGRLSATLLARLETTVVRYIRPHHPFRRHGTLDGRALGFLRASAMRGPAAARRNPIWDACGPSASGEMVRFFLQHSTATCVYRAQLQQRALADVHMAAISVRARIWKLAGRRDMRLKSIAAVTVGPLIALGLLLIREMRRKKLVSAEVSALRNLGSDRKAG